MLVLGSVTFKQCDVVVVVAVVVLVIFVVVAVAAVVVVVVVVVGYTPTQRPREVRFFTLMMFLPLEHMFDDTQTGCFSRGGVGWGGDDDVPCT